MKFNKIKEISALLLSDKVNKRYSTITNSIKVNHDNKATEKIKALWLDELKENREIKVIGRVIFVLVLILNS